MKYTIIILLTLFTISCNESFLYEGDVVYEDNIDKNNSKYLSISTQANSKFIYKDTDFRYIIQENSSVFINKKSLINDFELTNGNAVIIHKTLPYKDIDTKIYLESKSGKTSFLRIKLSNKIQISNKTATITYILTDGTTKEINQVVHSIFNTESFSYYGFYIPYPLYWDIESVYITTNFEEINKKLIKTFHFYNVEKVDFPTQIIRFKKSASSTIQNVDRTKANSERARRNAIRDENNIYDFSTEFKFTPPLDDMRYMTSDFGFVREWILANGKSYSKSIHYGVDYAQKEGTPIYANATGIVRFAVNSEFYGNTVIIDHGFGLFTDYSHMKEIAVNEGDIVTCGSIIGYVGQTGAATGPHIHWGARIYNIPIDPRSLINNNMILIE